jgi:Flp pilus assembly protein TadG
MEQHYPNLNRRSWPKLYRINAHLQRRSRRCPSETGTAVLEMAFSLILLLPILFGAIDLGRGYYLSIEVSSAARAGAQYGVQNSADTGGMQTAATNDAPDVSGISATAAYGCECSDGTSVTPQCGSIPSCASNVVNYVQVNTTGTYTPMFPWPGIPSSIPLHGKAVMRAGQ